jgi:pantoate--beta-alanine ligase
VREEDGLAMSSRNAYLTPAEREVAGRLNRVIASVAEAIADGGAIDAALSEGRKSLASQGLSPIDYLEVRSESDLAPLGPGPLADNVQGRVFAAVILGKTRLIDNWPIVRVESKGV